MKSIKITACLIFSSLATISFLCSCSKPGKEDQYSLRGKYINQTYLNQIPDSIPGLVNAYCFEMDFVSDDSVKILYGFEEATLGYKKDGKRYKLIKALRDKDMQFQFNADSTLSLSDGIWNDSPGNSIFSKTNPTEENWDFENHLNQKMIAGAYVLYKNERATNQNIVFSQEGKVTGLANFKLYKICYSGDCVGETYPVSNNITFIDVNGESKTFAFTIKRINKMLRISTIEAPIPNIKGERAVKEMVYDLRM